MLCSPLLKAGSRDWPGATTLIGYVRELDRLKSGANAYAEAKVRQAADFGPEAV